MTTTGTAARRGWIVSAWWDLTYIVLTPAAIVPLVLVAVCRWLTPEQLSLAVISFASLGHHLPGFLRAYGDRALVGRYAVRLAIAPAAFLGLALLFTPPRALAARWDLPWTHLHGLELILLVWGTWHGLMQTYGFMRIYALRRGENRLLEARLDQALCLAMFVSGVAFSDARMLGIASAMGQSGLPVLDPAGLAAIRWATGAASLATLACYLTHLAVCVRRGERLNGPKLLLAASTGWFFWYAGSLSTNLLIGVAMFEIFHAVQYNAIVWIYNRRLWNSAGERLGVLGKLFRDRWSMLGAYLALIAAYSSIRWFAGDGDQHLFMAPDRTDAYQWLFALFVTSSFLHFYLDGFIWKVSEETIRQPLASSPVGGLLPRRLVPPLAHAAKWSVLLGLSAALLAAEKAQLAEDPAAVTARRQRALARLAPDLPEMQLLRGRLAVEAGSPREAAALARAAAAHRGASAAIVADAGALLLDAGDSPAARELLRQAAETAPGNWRYRMDLGLAEQAEGRWEAAEAAFLQAAALAPAETLPRRYAAQLQLAQGRPAEAARELQRVTEETPDDAGAWRGWGAALAAQEQFAEADAALSRAVQLEPRSAEGQYLLGLARLRGQQPGAAVVPLRRAAELEPDNGEAHLQLGVALYQLGKWRQAAEALREAVARLPDQPAPYVNLGSALWQSGDARGAEAAYAAGLKAAPDSPELNYNLGMLQLGSGREREGRLLLEKAGRLAKPAP